MKMEIGVFWSEHPFLRTMVEDPDDERDKFTLIKYIEMGVL